MALEQGAPAFPLEDKARRILDRLPKGAQSVHTGLNREYYLDLAEIVVRWAVEWQDDDGIIVEPFPMDNPPLRHPSGREWTKPWARESPTGTARFAGAVARLVSANRCGELTEAGIKALEAVAEGMATGPRPGPVPGPDFCTKELVPAHNAFQDAAPRHRKDCWRQWLSGLDPRDVYIGAHNWRLYAVVGEYERHLAGLEGDLQWIDEEIGKQKEYFTPYGMYKDPNDPITYDLSVRQNLSLMVQLGYEGRHRSWIDEMLRRGGITLLLCVSPTGQAPFGGRSNQFHFVEGMIACICEVQARRYAAQGEEHVAGAFKRTARLAAASTERWLRETPFRHIKNRFPPAQRHGIDSYGNYSVYGLLAANLLAVAWHLADESIDEAPAPADAGGYAVELPDDFHKVFVTCRDYHLQLDTKADPKHDATGLGRLHRRGVPTELALSMPIAATPAYRTCVPAAARSAGIGPAWTDASGRWHALADFSDRIESIRVDDLYETQEEVRLRVVYEGALGGCSKVIEEYTLDSEGLLVVNEVHGAGSGRIRARFPLLRTDGMAASEIATETNRFRVRYGGHICDVTCMDVDAAPGQEDGDAPNRNGLYRIGFFGRKGCRISYRLSMTQENAGTPPPVL